MSTSHAFDAWDDHNPAMDSYRGPGDDAADAMRNTLRDVLALTDASESLPAAEIVFRVHRIAAAALERLGALPTADAEVVDLAEIAAAAGGMQEEVPF